MYTIRSKGLAPALTPSPCSHTTQHIEIHIQVKPWSVGGGGPGTNIVKWSVKNVGLEPTLSNDWLKWTGTDIVKRSVKKWGTETDIIEWLRNERLEPTLSNDWLKNEGGNRHCRFIEPFSDDQCPALIVHQFSNQAQLVQHNSRISTPSGAPLTKLECG